eukprot:7382868-Prymnesium_polylepis.1
MDFSALEALCTRIVPKLLLLMRAALTQNQRAGADQIGGGERNEAGLQLLLSTLSSTSQWCATHRAVPPTPWPPGVATPRIALAATRALALMFWSALDRAPCRRAAGGPPLCPSRRAPALPP